MLKQKLLKIKKFALDVIFPPCCLGCGKNLEDDVPNTREFNHGFHEYKILNAREAEHKSREYFPENHPFVCDDCFASIPINNALYCPICFSRIAGAKLCSHAQKSNLSYLGFAANYENELLKNIIWNLKYRFVRNLSETLALILCDYLLSVKMKLRRQESAVSPFKYGAERNPAPKTIGANIYPSTELAVFWCGIKNLASYCIIPVPLHKSRFKWRGFNQSELIAKKLAEKLNLTFISNILVRVKKTKDQTKLDKEKRCLNMQNAFSIKKPEILSGKNIILIDDVYTSGATMEEAAKTLKQAGAKKIIGLVIAKG